jgi:heme-degrading monooxygenase HmoA
MYARIITSQLKPGTYDQATAIWRTAIVPNLEHQPGFKGGYMSGDRHTGKGTVITLWETEADATAMDSSGLYQQSIDLLVNLLISPPSREQLEVMVRV